VAPHVYNLRSRGSFKCVERALLASAGRFDTKVVDFSIQGNHIHLMVEAADSARLRSAMQAFSIRFARAMNRMMGRTGKVLGDRFHSHVLRTPTEVKRALTYIRDNARKHAAERGEQYSAAYADPYASTNPEHRHLLPPPDTWLLREGWRRGR
jgi:putative transposase